MAEEGLIEGVDARVQGAHILADLGHFLADGVGVQAEDTKQRYQQTGQYPQQSDAGSNHGSDDLGSVAYAGSLAHCSAPFSRCFRSLDPEKVEHRANTGHFFGGPARNSRSAHNRRGLRPLRGESGLRRFPEFWVCQGPENDSVPGKALHDRGCHDDSGMARRWKCHPHLNLWRRLRAGGRKDSRDEDSPDTLRKAIAERDWEMIEQHGGLNEVMSKIGKKAEGGRIDGFTLWRSERCRQIGAQSTKGA